MAFCGNKHLNSLSSVHFNRNYNNVLYRNSINESRKLVIENDKSSSDKSIKRKFEEDFTSPDNKYLKVFHDVPVEQHNDSILSNYVKQIAKYESPKYIGYLSTTDLEAFLAKSVDYKDIPMKHHFCGEKLFNSFNATKSTEKSRVMDLIWCNEMYKIYTPDYYDNKEGKVVFDGMQVKYNTELAQPKQQKNYVQHPFIPSQNQFDIPIFITKLSKYQKNKINVMFIDDIITRKYIMYLRQTLFNINIYSEIIVVDTDKIGVSEHNGFRLLVYGIIQSLILSNVPLFVPGFNFRELVRDYSGYNIVTNITNKGYMKQWCQCIFKDFCYELIKLGGKYNFTDIDNFVKDSIKDYLIDTYDIYRTMFLAFNFTPYLCDHYDINKDYCLINKYELDYVSSKSYNSDHGFIYYDDAPIASVQSERTPFGCIFSVQMYANKQRIYYDLIPTNFYDKILKQPYFEVPKSNILIFHPDIKYHLQPDDKELPLIKGIDNFGQCLLTFKNKSCPESFVFTDTVDDIIFNADGPWHDHCYIKSIIESLKDHGQDGLINPLVRDFARILAGTDESLPEFVANGPNEQVIVQNDLNNLPPNYSFDAAPDSLPDGISAAALLLCLNNTFGSNERRMRFKLTIRKLDQWRQLYQGNQQNLNDDQLLDAIANQYNVNDIPTPYSTLRFIIYFINVDRTFTLDSHGVPIEGTESWNHNVHRYVYNRNIQDEERTIRIAVVSNIVYNKQHAYTLYNCGKTDPCDLFLMKEKDFLKFVKEYPKNRLGGYILPHGDRIRHTEKGFVPQFTVYNPNQRNADGSLTPYENYWIEDADRFYRMLDCRTNYVEIDNATAQRLHFYYYEDINGHMTKIYFKYLISQKQFAPRALQLLKNEFASIRVDETYIRLLLGLNLPYIEKHYLRIDYRYINLLNSKDDEIKILGLPWISRWKGPNRMKKPLRARINDWRVYKYHIKDTELQLTDNIDKHTLTPIFVDTRLITAYDLFGAAKRPTQAYYRDVIRIFSSNYIARDLTNQSIYLSETLFSQSLIYMQYADGMDRIHVDGNVCGCAHTLKFHPEMKSVPFINDIPTKMDSDGNIEKEILFYYAFPSPSYLLGKSIMYYYNNTNHCNIKECVCARQLMYRGGHVVHETVYKAFKLFYKVFYDYFEGARALTARELLEVHKNGAKYKSVYCSIDAILLLVFSAFIKTEPYPIKFDDQKVKPPRLIMNPGKLVNFFMITFSHELENCLKAMPYFAKGKNSHQTALDLKYLWDQLRHPCAIGMDFTQFEHFVSTTVLVASMSIFADITGMPQDIIKTWVRRVVYMCKLYKLSFLATRISGEFQTSFGNMLIVGAILLLVITLVKAEHPDSDAFFYSAGDDCMILCNIEDIPLYQNKMSEIVADFGMIVKTEDIYYRFDEIHFCQQYPVEVIVKDENGNDTETWWMINDLVRVLDKLAVQPKVPRLTKADLNRWACLGCYIEFMFGSLPELRELILNLKNLAPYKMHGKYLPDFRRAFNTSQDWHIIEALGSSHNFEPCYRIKDPKRMYEVCGMTQDIMNYYSSYFKSWSPYDYVDQNVDVEFYCDDDGNTVFSYCGYDLCECKHKYADGKLKQPVFQREDPTYTKITDQWFQRMVSVCGGYAEP